jgi:lysozyme family protein
MSDSWLSRLFGGGSNPVPAPPLAQAQTAPVPIDNFLPCITYVLRREGGFSDNPNDAGKATNFGITAATLALWLDRPVTTDEVRNMPLSTAMQIYRIKFWNAMRCFNFPPGVDLSVLDPGVMSGPPRGVKFLQFALQQHQDGLIGPETMDALRAVNDTRALISRIAQERRDFYQELVNTIPTDGIFLQGWQNRVDLTEQASLAMVPA